ncbi:Endonuclease VIII-like 1 [Giardia duodenalis]|uniref:Endonuclease VIII-like 1 n=1 Tax=Giardia intestinalis (strain ATCC 50803 / WB clone C6) TaxID=184922 RepID=D3KHA2_GIAIC|nr:Endonuclease VIII-like 1 [Giardia intestinalis]XP_037901620.1 Endonuclease VIII-like 1 [Giardia intestinalis]KAE8301637.1 Endonuclease VIII-like 1 [Giardia intestinalis]KAE8301642.1 Endonuclease VIII-like 1 [Giardia intestinalis]
MPEHPEVRAFAERITFEAEHTLFTNVSTSRACVYKALPPLFLDDSIKVAFTIRCESRGKQLRVDLARAADPPRNEAKSIFVRLKRNTSDTSETPYDLCKTTALSRPWEHSDHAVALTIPTSIVIGLGLAGCINTFLTPEEALKSNAHLLFEASDAVLAVCSPRPETMYWRVGDFDHARSPDPVAQYLDYVSKILSKLSHIPIGLDGSFIVPPKSIFSQPICRLLLSQELFNGVGNYLRAEAMHRLLIHPFTPSVYVFEELIHWVHDTVRETPRFHNLSNKWRSLAEKNVSIIETKCPLIPMIRRLCEEAYAVLDDHRLFSEWLLCYKKATNCILDSGGREVWFFEKLVANKSSHASEHGDKKNSAEKPDACTLSELILSSEPSLKKVAVQQLATSNAENVILNSTENDADVSQLDILEYSRKDLLRRGTVLDNLPIDSRNESASRWQDKIVRKSTVQQLHDARTFQASLQSK